MLEKSVGIALGLKRMKVFERERLLRGYRFKPENGRFKWQLNLMKS